MSKGEQETTYGFTGQTETAAGSGGEIGFVEPSLQQPKLPAYGDVDRDARMSDIPEDFSYGVYVGMKISECTDEALRQGFICKVYAILCFQLVITFGIVSVFTFVESIRDYVNGTSDSSGDGWWIMLIVAFVVFLVVYIVIICSKTVRRKVPYNYIFLTVFTAAVGYLLGVLASVFDTIAVVEAMAALSGICFLMTLFGCQKRIPLGGIFIAIFTLAVSAISISIFAIFTYNDFLPSVYATIIVALFSLILLVDTWMILNSGHHEVLMEEYVFCALILYVDIVYIFMYLLMILGGSARN